MSIAKTSRVKKRQLGQFLTPIETARELVSSLSLKDSDRVLEPSMGDGSFVIPLIERFLELYTGTVEERLGAVLRNNVHGVEIDPELYERCLARVRAKWGPLPSAHNFRRCDFFRCHFGADHPPGRSIFSASLLPSEFDYVVGNPPFGGTLDPEIQDILDGIYGFRGGEKIKKETYSFFIVKGLDLLKTGGRLTFICSDTFLTINTMSGLRRLLVAQGDSSVRRLEHFSGETQHPMVVLDFEKTGASKGISLDGNSILREDMELTGNFSWTIAHDLAECFRGPSLGDFVVATSGMTVGRNEYFIREVRGGKILEPYAFEFFDDPITAAGEKAHARLGYIPPERLAEIQALEAAGMTHRNVRVVTRKAPVEVDLPHRDYCPYNKGTGAIVYAPPTHVIYWSDDGDAVLTFKRNGNWYLHGVGGQQYFKREGLTWRLISDTLDARYLPGGYILDSGAPCAFLRRGVGRDELYFILAWALSPLCERLLKEVINHTRNIQSKDFERLPYPFWVSEPNRQAIIASMKRRVEDAMNGASVTRSDPVLRRLGRMFDVPVKFEIPLQRRYQELTLFDRRRADRRHPACGDPWMTSDRNR
jgi:hypothetical protein